tara:strand:- start:5368 stop:5556 length:189 start_codon:yes stop_codon:yes gene_type:complete
LLAADNVRRESPGKSKASDPGWDSRPLELPVPSAAVVEPAEDLEIPPVVVAAEREGSLVVNL